MNVGVNYLREHIIQQARIHYVIEAGGGQPNVVPDYARSWYYVRAPEMDQLESHLQPRREDRRGRRTNDRDHPQA